MKLIKSFRKFTTVFASLILLLLLPSLNFAQWEERSNGLPEGWSYVFSISAVDSLNAIISLRPYLFKTANGGTTWEQIIFDSEENGNVSHISMIDINNVWIVTEKSKIFKLTRALQKSILQFYDTTKVNYMNYIEMFDKNTGIAMGDGKEFNNGVPIFLKTTNGGEEWISMNNSAIGGASGDTWRRLDFVNENTGYFFESGNNPQKLYKTKNSDSTWQATNFSRYADIIKFYNEDYGLIYFHSCNSDSTTLIMRTIDGGITWNDYKINAAGWGNDIEFVPGNPAKVWFTDFSSIYFSSDSGKTWSEIKITNGELGGRDILFLDENIGWLLCNNGKVYRTTNGGLGTTSVKTNNNIPESYKLMQNYPNPFNPETTIGFQLPVSSQVILKVYNILGKEITTLVKEFKQAGYHQVKFNSSIYSFLSSGVYFYTLQTNDFTETKKMLLIK